MHRSLARVEKSKKIGLCSIIGSTSGLEEKKKMMIACLTICSSC